MSELYHYGIKGMRWGVRRWQNKDGSLTSAGKKRYQSITSVSQVFKMSQKLKKIGYSDFKKLQSPEETEKKHAGSCHDQVIYTLDKLKKAGVDARARFMIEYDPKTQEGGTTHSYVYVPFENGVLWIENAFKGQEGVHKYSSVDEIEKQFKKLRVDGKWGNISKFSKVEFQDFNPDDHNYGETLEELVLRTLK